MNRVLPAAICIGLVGAAGMFLPGAFGISNPSDARLRKVLADWQERQNWFPVVEFQVRGEHKVPQGAYSSAFSPGMAREVGLEPGKVVPPRDVEAPVGFTMLLDLVNERHRRDILEQSFDFSDGKLFAVRMTDVFDGSLMKCLIPRAKNPDLLVSVTQPELTVVSGNMKNGAFRSNYYPIFFGLGRAATVMEPILPGQLRNKPNADYIYIHGTGVHDGRACLILRTQTLQTATTTFDEYWVDPSRDSAIVRFLSYSGNDPSQETSITYRKDHNHWLPHGWRWSVRKRGKTLYYEDMRVEGIRSEPEITDADFELEAKPGMLVEERTDLPTLHPIATPESKTSVYRIKKDGERQQIPDPARRRSDQYKPLEKQKITLGWRQWTWAVPVALFLVSGGSVWLRRRRTRP